MDTVLRAIVSHPLLGTTLSITSFWAIVASVSICYIYHALMFLDNVPIGAEGKWKPVPTSRPNLGIIV
jgi:hypothetical protein